MKVLLISYDFHSKGKPLKTLAIASLEAAIRKNIQNINVATFSFNMNDQKTIPTSQTNEFKKMLMNDFNFIAIGYYSWCKEQVTSLIRYLKQNYPSTKIILGGYEVNSSTIDYLTDFFVHLVDHYILGYAEKSIVDIIKGLTKDIVVNNPLERLNGSTIYASNIIDLENVCTVSIETKRGCPMKCSYCSYNSNDHQNILIQDIQILKEEFSYLNHRVEKVNIIDPIFTIKNYESILDYLISIDFKPMISIQVKFETLYNILVKNDLIKKFKKLNIILEFGYQTQHVVAIKNINREVDSQKIEFVIKELVSNNIRYEISVIRGLPGETIESYKKMIDGFIRNNIFDVKFFPLTMLSNTSMFHNQQAFNIKTKNNNGLKVVYETYSYDEKDYRDMENYEKYFFDVRGS